MTIYDLFMTPLVAYLLIKQTKIGWMLRHIDTRGVV